MAVKRILLVDDDAGHAYLAMRRLKANKDYDIQWASSGQEALDILYKSEATGNLPHLVLLDLNMPGLNGFDVMQHLDADPELKAIPRIIVSTSDEPEDLIKSADYGHAGYIVKPIDYMALSLRIHKLFDNKED